MVTFLLRRPVLPIPAGVVLINSICTFSFALGPGLAFALALRVHVLGEFWVERRAHPPWVTKDSTMVARGSFAFSFALTIPLCGPLGTVVLLRVRLEVVALAFG